MLDVETTGLGPRAEPMEVAVVDPSGEPLLDSLIRPEGPVEPEAVRLHGLDAAALAGAPTFATLYPDLERVLRGRIVVAYWAVFDRTILDRACRVNGLPPLAVSWHCAHAHYVACHRAATDARRVWELLQRMGWERKMVP